MPPVTLDHFEPALYSLPELRFLVNHLGQPPLVAFRRPLEPGIVRPRVERLLRVVADLEELRKAESGFVWAGVDSIQESISRFFDWYDKSKEIERRGYRDASGAVIANPSHYVWDEDGRAYKLGVGCDSADMVRSEITAEGTYKPFRVMLLQPNGQVRPQDITDIAPWLKSARTVAGERQPDSIIDRRSPKSKKVGHLVCSVCDHQEAYNPAVRMQRTAAMGRMMRHLRIADNNQNRHAILLAVAKAGKKQTGRGVQARVENVDVDESASE